MYLEVTLATEYLATLDHNALNVVRKLSLDVGPPEPTSNALDAPAGAEITLKVNHRFRAHHLGNLCANMAERKSQAFIPLAWRAPGRLFQHFL